MDNLARLARASTVACLMMLALRADAATDVDRLVTLARVWSTVKYMHPAFLERPVKWDEALLHAIPRVTAATDDAAFEAAVADMLAELGDPATRLEPDDASSTIGSGGNMPAIGRLDGDTYVLSAGEAIEKAGYFGFREMVRGATADLAKARYVIVDLRTSRRNPALSALGEVASLVTRDAVTAPPRWVATYSGYMPDEGQTSGGYFPAFTLLPGDRTAPGASKTFERVAFIVSPGSTLPDPVAALRAAGAAVIVSTAPLDSSWFSNTTSVSLGTGKSAVIRVDELAAEVTADAVVTGSDPDAAMAKARELVRTAVEPRSKLRSTPVPVITPNDAYASITDVPPVELRLLAAFRIWSTIDRFYPYKHLIGDWDAAFKSTIPRFIGASTRNDYVAAVLELSAFVEDGHTSVSGPGVPGFFGAHFTHAEVRLVRGEFVVTALGETAAKAGLRVGDVVRTVDGEPLRTRVKQLYKYLTASTVTARMNRVARYAMRGPAGSIARLGIERRGKPLTIDVPRALGYALMPVEGPKFRMLNKQIGYADLTRLTPAEVEPMFGALREAKSIIFDMRGYPNGTAWSIAPRLGSGEPRVAARFMRRQIAGPLSVDSETSFSFTQLLPDGRALQRFQGATYMLIDDRAISQSEHTGLFLETANGTKFIGTPTAGANGDVTSMRLPGGMLMAFTGHDVRHANGDQLQRVGLKPALLVEPTINGLQAGKDEVLDAAIAYAEKALR